MNFKHIIIALALAAAPGAGAQSPDGASLEALVAEAGALCPQKLDRGSTLDAVGLADDAIEIRMSMALPAAQFPVIEQNLGMMRPTLLKMMAGTDDMRRIFALAAGSNRGLRLVIACADKPEVSFTLAYSAAELAAEQ